jgi:hypothetical protein
MTDGIRELASQAQSLSALISQEADAKSTVHIASEIGNAFARQRRWRYAGFAMLVAARLDPLHAPWTQAVGKFALQLVRAGVPAPKFMLPNERAPGKISFIVCSITPSKLAALRANLERLMSGDAWELIHIHDARSLAEGYNRGLDRAVGELVVLCHDDIAILCDDFAAKLRSYLARFDVIGVAGATTVTGPAWDFAGVPHLWCWVGHPLNDGRPTSVLAGLHGPCVVGAQALDGLFLAGRRSAVESIRFDAQTFDGFHFYDLDFSYRAWKAGLACGVCLDITIFHDSIGHYSDDFMRYADRFREKFPEACIQDHFGSRMSAVALARREELTALHQWLARWVSMSNEQLLERVLAGAAEIA